MGLLDSVLGGMLGGGGNAQSNPQAALISAIIGMLGQGGGAGAQAGAQGAGFGGLGGLVEAFARNGMGDVAKSWVGTGQNLPVSPDQLGQVLGGGTIDNMASQLGMNQSDLLGQLSQMLPQVVDRLTPNGQVPQGDLGGMGDLAGMLGGLLRR